MHDLIGKQVGEFLIEEGVGSGSTGQTFRARDDKKQQVVALKLVHTHLASQPAFQEKWLSNATSIPALQHQAIAHVTQVGEANGQLFAATEWVRGETLGHVLHSGQPLALRMAGRLVQIAGDALVYAHRQGVIHGGLQPFNVLLAPHGGELPWRPLLTDFRQASLIPGEPLPTLLPYLSPEQCDGKRPNGRSDVYALGILLYQLCTGQLPFQPASTRDVLAGGTPPPPRSLRPEMPTVLEAIILKAMARNTAERYRSMEEFLLFLRREVDKLPTDGSGAMADAAMPVSPPPPVVMPAPARPSPSPAPIPVPVPVPAAVVAPPTSSDTDYLIIRHARLEPQTFLLHKWLITIGIQRDNDLVLTGEGVAAKHARLERTDTGWNVIDMGSLNGTFLEGSQLLADMPEPWKPSQMVRLGEYTLEWKSGLAQKQPQAAVPAQVVDSGRLYMNMQPTQLATHAGMPAQAVLEIENQTARGLSILLGVLGIPPLWVAVEPALIHLSPQQKVIVPFTIQPPRHHSATAGLHQFQIEAQAEGGRETAVANGQLTIHPFSQFFAEMQPATLRHGKAGEVKLTNEGNSRSRFTTSVADVNNELAFELSPTEVESVPGETHSLRLTGRGRKRPLFLRANIVPFELRVAGGTVAAPQPGRLIVPPLISWLLLLALLLPLLVILAFLFYGGGRDFAEPCEGLFKVGDLAEACQVDSAVVVATAVLTATVSAEPQATITVPAAATDTPETVVIAEATAVGAQRLVIGNSVNGEEIVAWKIGDGPNPILFVGGMHAGASPDSIALAEALRVRLAASPELIPAAVTIYIVPEWNPDSAGAGNGRLNANGVDLNRNWNCSWELMDDGRSGAAPLSEPESLAMSEFVLGIAQPVVAVFWNTPASAGNAGKVSPGRCAQAQTAASRELARLYAEGVEGYEADQADTAQRISGDVTDSIADMGIPSVFVLLNNSADVDAHLPAVQAIMEAYGNE